MLRERAFIVLTVGLIASSTLMFAGCGAKLTDAAINGDIGTANKLLQEGKNLNEMDGYGWTPLLWATYYQHPEMVMFLLDKGADPDIAATKQYVSVPPGSTPLIIASYYGREDMVEILLQHGARKDVKNTAGYTALMYAKEYRFKDCERLLDQ